MVRPSAPPRLLLAALALALGGPAAGCGGEEPPSRTPAPPDGPAAREAGPYAGYTNGPYRFSLVYPPALLHPAWPPPGLEADSRGFLAVNDEAALRAYGRLLRPGQHLAALQRRLAASYDTVAYEATRDSTFVLSGYRDDRIAYTRVVRRGDTLLTLELEYDRDRRALYDRVVEAVAPSFPGGPPAPPP